MLQFRKMTLQRCAVWLLAGFLCFVICPGKLVSHPLGNFTINHFARLDIQSDHLEITYVIDMAEIPTFGELRVADTNGDGRVSEAELQAYLKRVTPSYARDLLLLVDGKPQRIEEKGAQISSPPGAGGLHTLRLQFLFRVPWVSSVYGSPHRLEFEDTNQPDRIGWREIVVTPHSGITVFNSSAFANSVSNELRSYPADMLASPLDERKAQLSWVGGPAPPGVPVLRTRNGRLTVTSRDRLSELIAVKEITLGVALLGLLLACILGAAHALSPGHGKTVVGAYLVGSRGTPRHAAFLGLTVTVTHTAGVFALGVITLFASRYVLPERLFPILSLASGALVAFIGLSLFVRRLGVAFGFSSGYKHAHDPGDGFHMHTHSHGGRTHSHLPPGSNNEAVTWPNLLALGISGGLLPCPSALVVLLSAVALHRIGYGLLLVLAFSAGLAGTLTCVGLTFVYAGRWLNRSPSMPKIALLQRIFPVLSALVVACLGLAICYEAMSQAGFHSAVFIQTALTRWHAAVSGESSLSSMGVLAVLSLGLILGMKHATEVDHVIAVSNIVSEHRKLAKVALVGGLWGIGHTLTLVLVGFFVLLLGISIPERTSQYLEFCVGLMIIGLSLTALARVLRGRSKLHAHTHSHKDAIHAHLHFHESDIQHDDSIASHYHQVSRIGLKPLLVGAVHGLAGSAALTLLVLTQVRSVIIGLGYLLVFGLGSVLGMIAVSTIIGLPFAISARKLTKVSVGLQIAAGLVGVCFGCWYAYSAGTTAFA